MATVMDLKNIVNSISVASPVMNPDDGGRFKVRTLCQALTLTRKDIALMTNKTPQWFQDHWADRFVRITEADVKATLEQLVLIYVLISNLFKEEGQGRLWLRLPNPAFDNRTPASLMVDGELARVRDSLIELLTGGTPA